MRPTVGRLSLIAALLVVVAVVGQAVGSYPGSGYVGSLLAQAPGDETVGAALCTSHERPVSYEEGLRGTSDDRLRSSRAWLSAMDPEPVVGYLDRTTARCGDKVGVHLSGKGPAVLSAYRVGWYGGAGTRLVWTSPRVPTRTQAPVALDPSTYMNEASWPTTTTLTVQPDWTPGFYLVVVSQLGSRKGAGAGSIMPLIVQHRGQARLLAVASTLTWLSYNDYGGHSTYHGPNNDDKRSTIGSMDRPMTGSGLRHMLVYDVPLARFLGRAGIETEWTSADQLDTEPSLV
ncbi:MAG: hypothetical protein M3P04_11395, partial [Actinomycetota bacterium]|nr:hypothetical protein [Actinomycetota bacterium]